jgi:hypothetical protein
LATLRLVPTRSTRPSVFSVRRSCCHSSDGKSRLPGARCPGWSAFCHRRRARLEPKRLSGGAQHRESCGCALRASPRYVIAPEKQRGLQPPNGGRHSSCHRCQPVEYWSRTIRKPPGGATDNSPGAQALGLGQSFSLMKSRRDDRGSKSLSFCRPLSGAQEVVGAIVFPGLKPWAIVGGPSGAKTRCAGCHG